MSIVPTLPSGLLPPDSEEDLLPLSGLEHVVFCPRQCALIHVERIWIENAMTTQGKLLHERVDTDESSARPGVRVERSLPLRCLSLGVFGKADLVEFHFEEGPGGEEIWRPYPVEYKRGARRPSICQEVQLCAQAMALEECSGLQVPRGAIYHAASRHRREVQLDERLRAVTRQAATEFRRLVQERSTPLGKLEPKCRSCSLLEVCMPQETSASGKARRYVERLIREHTLPGGEPLECTAEGSEVAQEEGTDP